MPDLAASDVTYTEQAGTRQTVGDSRTSVVYKVEFGDGALTYPSGGVPLTKANLGLPNDVEKAHIMDSSDDGLVYKYDYENDAIKIYHGDYSVSADGALVEYSSGSTAIAAADLYIEFVGW